MELAFKFNDDAHLYPKFATLENFERLECASTHSISPQDDVISSDVDSGKLYYS